MHSIAEIGSNVPAFLGKLWKMVEDPETNDLIAWSSTGTSFVIKDEIRFARELLPMYYKHNNMASFVRQLNMYGFHKIVSPDAGSMKLETIDEVEFTHPFFMRGHPYLLENIKRKIGVNKAIAGQLGEKTPQVINKVLTDVRQMKGRQESMESRLTAMKMENGALWRELSVLRQKHIKQQQIVNKLIQFLVTIVQQNHNSFSVKRKYPRMLQHHDKSPSKVHHDDDHETASNVSKSPLGPIIHELDPAEALLETVVEEAESADAESPSEVTEYYLGQSGEVGEEEVDDMGSASFEIRNLSDPSSLETIVGMPEDTLFVQSSRSRHPQNISSKSQTTIPLVASSKVKKEPELLRPKFAKLIMRKPKIEIENLQRVPQRQQSLKNIQQQAEQNLKLQIKVNQQQIEKNQKQLERSQQEVKEQQQVLKSQQNQLRKNQKHLQKNNHHFQSNQVQFQKNHLQARQSQSGQRQSLVIPGLVQHAQTSIPVISIPFDSSEGETIVPDVETTTMEPMYVESGTEQEQFGVPVVVEIVDGSPAQAQASPMSVTPQDLLLGSPLVMNDPVMTPQCESVVTPVGTPSEASPTNSSDMQVACVQDEPQVTSPSLVTRNEMDSHLDSVQSDLENLKELLRSEGISLDANALLGYFNDDPLSFNISDPVTGEDSDRSKENSGNEVMAYNPSLFDLADLMGNEWNLPSPGENLPNEETFPEVNTPQFVPQSPSFPTPAKKRKT